MIKLRPFLAFTLLISMIISCTSEHGKRLPRHTGQSGEVFIIMPENEWDGSIGDSLRYYFQKAYPMVPQAEPMFKLFHIRPAKLNNLLKQHRNIIQVEIGNDSISENKVLFQKDKWSSNQLFFRILAEDSTSFFKLIRENAPRIADRINTTEISRIQSFNQTFPNRSGIALIKEKFGIDIDLQEEYHLIIDTTDFVWFQRERIKYLSNTAHDITQGIIIFSYPYQTDSAFIPENALAVRDSMLEMYIKGPKEGSFMTTEYRITPTTEVIDTGQNYRTLTRGLWKMENYFMGGPFVSVTMLNRDHTKIISVSGYAFAPKFDKREYIREVEATIKSAKNVED